MKLFSNTRKFFTQFRALSNGQAYYTTGAVGPTIKVARNRTLDVSEFPQTDPGGDIVAAVNTTVVQAPLWSLHQGNQS